MRFAPRSGPATLIGMSAAADGWRLAWLEGEAIGEASPNLRGVAVRFRPDDLDPLAAASSWISAGVTHHPVLVPGRIGATLALLAAKLSGTSEERYGEATIAAAAQRGKQRRYNAMRRRAS